MNLKLDVAPVPESESDALVVFAFEKRDSNPESAQAADAAAGGWIGELYASGEFSGKPLETALLHRPAGLKAKRLLVVGGGKAENFGGAEVRAGAAAALTAYPDVPNPEAG